MPDAHDLPYCIVFRDLTLDEADVIGLTLASEGIPSQFSSGMEGVDIAVPVEQQEAARGAVQAYYEENSGIESPLPISYPIFPVYSSLLVGGWLIALHLAIGDNLRFFVRYYGAAAENIIEKKEIYRTATALLLHADVGHLAGNVAGIVVFGAAVRMVAGLGVGWFMILITGVAGNYLNAWLRQAPHVSIGASTAVFGAIGILAGYQLISKYQAQGVSWRSASPLLAGLALLGFLGVAEQADLMAHLFGFGVGIILGSCYGRWILSPAGALWQSLFLLLGLGILGVSLAQGL